MVEIGVLGSGNSPLNPLCPSPKTEKQNQFFLFKSNFFQKLKENMYVIQQRVCGYGLLRASASLRPYLPLVSLRYIIPAANIAYTRTLTEKVKFYFNNQTHEKNPLQQTGYYHRPNIGSFKLNFPRLLGDSLRHQPNQRFLWRSMGSHDYKHPNLSVIIMAIPHTHKRQDRIYHPSHFRNYSIFYYRLLDWPTRSIY